MLLFVQSTTSVPDEQTPPLTVRTFPVCGFRMYTVGETSLVVGEYVGNDVSETGLVVTGAALGDWLGDGVGLEDGLMVGFIDGEGVGASVGGNEGEATAEIVSHC